MIMLHTRSLNWSHSVRTVAWPNKSFYRSNIRHRLLCAENNNQFHRFRPRFDSMHPFSCLMNTHSKEDSNNRDNCSNLCFACLFRDDMNPNISYKIYAQINNVLTADVAFSWNRFVFFVCYLLNLNISGGIVSINAEPVHRLRQTAHFMRFFEIISTDRHCAECVLCDVMKMNVDEMIPIHTEYKIDWASNGSEKTKRRK